MLAASVLLSVLCIGRKHRIGHGGRAVIMRLYCVSCGAVL